MIFAMLSGLPSVGRGLPHAALNTGSEPPGGQACDPLDGFRVVALRPSPSLPLWFESGCDSRQLYDFRFTTARMEGCLPAGTCCLSPKPVTMGHGRPKLAPRGEGCGHVGHVGHVIGLYFNLSASRAQGEAAGFGETASHSELTTTERAVTSMGTPPPVLEPNSHLI